MSLPTDVLAEPLEVFFLLPEANLFESDLYPAEHEKILKEAISKTLDSPLPSLVEVMADPSIYINI